MEGSRICGNLQVSPLLVISESYPQLGLVKLETPRKLGTGRVSVLHQRPRVASGSCHAKNAVILWGMQQDLARCSNFAISYHTNFVCYQLVRRLILNASKLAMAHLATWPTWLLGPLGYFAPQHRARTTSHGDLPQAQQLCAVEEPRPATANR